jgi:hypothetical protein
MWLVLVHATRKVGVDDDRARLETSWLEVSSAFLLLMRVEEKKIGNDKANREMPPKSVSCIRPTEMN